MRRSAPSKALNLNVRGLSPSATLVINEKSRELERNGQRVYKLGFGQSPFPVPEHVQEALRNNAFQKDYLPVKGLPELRTAVAEYTRAKVGIKRSTEDVLIGPGSKELMFLLQLVYYGDLLIPRPGWVSYAPQAQIVGRQVRWIKTKEKNGWRLKASELEQYCELDSDRPRILVLNYPANPTGTTYPREELIAIAEIAQKYNIIILSDEIYGELHFDGEHESIAHYYPQGTIISGGLSKWCGAGGWRLGTFIFPPGLHWLQDAMAVAASETFTTTSAPIQYAAVKAFRGGPEIETYLQRSRRVLRVVGHAVSERLRRHYISHPEPQGGFYLFPNFDHYRATLAGRGVMTGEQLCNRLLTETGVALLPGSDFGFSEKRLAARLSYVDFDGAAALKQLDAAGSEAEFLQSVAGHILEGIDRMCEWLQE